VYQARVKEGDDSTSASGGPEQRVVKAQRYSVSSEFRQQLQEMLGQIRATTPQFIRCIKPNPSNQPYIDMTAPAPLPLFDRKSVAEQLRYQGVLELSPSLALGSQFASCMLNSSRNSDALSLAIYAQDFGTRWGLWMLLQFKLSWSQNKSSFSWIACRFQRCCQEWLGNRQDAHIP